MAMTVARPVKHRSAFDRKRVEDARFVGEDCADVMNRRLALLPAVLSSTKLIRGPLLEAEATAQFGEEVNFTDVSVQSAGLITKLVSGGSVPTPFLIRGLCIAGRIVPYRYTALGAALVNTSTGAHVPEVVIPGNTEDTTMKPAQFDYNTQGVIAYDLFLRSYNFQYVLQGRFLMVNERAIDVGVVDSLTQPDGFGSGKYSPDGDIAEANEHFRALGAQIFAPPNCTTADNAGDPVAPTLVDLQFVQPRAPGVYGCCYPIRPHILWPLQTYQFIFERVANGQNEYDDLQRAVTLRTGLDKPIDTMTDSLTAGANGPAVFLGTVPFNYFKLELGIMFRGAEFMPEDALEWLMRWGFPYQEMWLKDPSVLMSLQGIASQAGLAGIPRPLRPGETLALGAAGDVVGMVGDPNAFRAERDANLWNKTERLKAMVNKLQEQDKAGAIHRIAP